MRMAAKWILKPLFLSSFFTFVMASLTHGETSNPNFLSISPDFLRSINCSSLVGSTVNPHFSINSTLTHSQTINYTLFEEIYKSEFESSFFHIPWLGCINSLNRLSCYTAMQHLGIGYIDVNNRFPDISWKPSSSPFKHLEKEKDTHALQAPTKIAYFILAHKDGDQVMRLISSLYTTSNYYLIHIDSKALDLKEELKNRSLAFKHGNVAVMEKSWDIIWGGIDMVYATLEGIFQFLDAGQWDFVINLSGSDYPLCDNDSFLKFLSENKGKNFDNAVPVYGNKVNRQLHSYVTCYQQLAWTKRSRTFPAQLPRTFQSPNASVDGFSPMIAYTGSQWFIYSRDFATFLRNDIFSRNLLSHFEHSFIPDEGYLPTVLMNSKFNNTRVPTNLRYIVFEPVLQKHPIVWTINNTDDLQRHTGPPSQTSMDHFDNKSFREAIHCFTRKFDISVDSAILDFLDNWRAEKKKGK